MFAALSLSAVLDEFQKLLHALAYRWFQLKLNAHPEAWIALDHDSVQREALHPDLLVLGQRYLSSKDH